MEVHQKGWYGHLPFMVLEKWLVAQGCNEGGDTSCRGHPGVVAQEHGPACLSGVEPFSTLPIDCSFVVSPHHQRLGGALQPVASLLQY